MALNAMSLIVGKVIRGPVVPKTEMFILFYYILSIDLPSHSCLCFTCPLFLLPSVSSVWVTALDGSLCVCILTSDSPSLIWFSLYVSYSFFSCVSLTSASPTWRLTWQPVVSHLPQPTVSACPAWPEWFAWVHCPSLLFHCVICASLKPHGLCSLPCIPCLLPSAPYLPSLSCQRRTPSHQ